MGRHRFMALSVLWVSSCPHEASGRSKGPTKVPTAGRFGKEGSEASSSRLGAGKVVQSFFSKFVELSSASCCGALSTHHCVLGDSLTPNLPLETLWTEQIPGPHSTLFPVVKHLVFVSCFLLIPGSFVETACCPWGMGTRMGFSFFVMAVMNRKTRCSSRASLCLSPLDSPVLSRTNQGLIPCPRGACNFYVDFLVHTTWDESQGWNQNCTFKSPLLPLLEALLPDHYYSLTSLT